MAKVNKEAHKQKLHKRNLHLDGYPITLLVQTYPPLHPYVVQKPDGSKTVNFADPKAVKALNAALLAHYYHVPLWDIPAGYLCPPIPGRADYVHYIADLLAEDNQGTIPTGKKIKGLDIGTGANLIYPIIASRSYGWMIVGSDIDATSIKSAKAIVSANSSLQDTIRLRQQSNPSNIFNGVIIGDEKFDFCMCNPPFHRSAADAQAGSQRKVKNLARHGRKRQSAMVSKNTTGLNFAGQSNELWCEGGELAFIQRMISESREYAKQIKWFTSLVSNKQHIAPLTASLKYIGAAEIKVIDMAQGQKVSRFIAWRF